MTRSQALIACAGTGLLALGMVQGGCSCAPLEEGEERAEAVFSEHHFVEAQTATKTYGESCVTGGRSDCATGYCIHFGPDPASDWICTKRCEKQSDCIDASFKCASVFTGGGPGTTFCIPPPDFEPRAVTP